MWCLSRMKPFIIIFWVVTLTTCLLRFLLKWILNFLKLYALIVYKSWISLQQCVSPLYQMRLLIVEIEIQNDFNPAVIAVRENVKSPDRFSWKHCILVWYIGSSFYESIKHLSSNCGAADCAQIHFSPPSPFVNDKFKALLPQRRRWLFQSTDVE